MARKLGIQYVGAIYHVMNRGDPSADLVEGMKWFWGVHTRRFNARLMTIALTDIFINKEKVTPSTVRPVQTPELERAA